MPLSTGSHPAKGRPPLLAAGLATGDSPLRAPCNRPPLQAPHYKRVCPWAVATPTGWPQLAIPVGVAL
ncbi:hypothetical protein BHM03_00053521 [Ensete ventricosum]|nr:hypothetical protein BHM03_00053521 [Ensete ventricosum]